MNETMRVGGGESLGCLATDPHDFRGRQPMFAHQADIQWLAFKELHGEIRDAALIPDLVDRDDVVIPDSGHCLGFAQEALSVHRFGSDTRKHRLDGDRTLEHEVFGAEHHTHAARAQDLEDAIASKPAQFLWAFRGGQKGGKLPGFQFVGASPPTQVMVRSSLFAAVEGAFDWLAMVCSLPATRDVVGCLPEIPSGCSVNAGGDWNAPASNSAVADESDGGDRRPQRGHLASWPSTFSCWPQLTHKSVDMGGSLNDGHF